MTSFIFSCCGKKKKRKNTQLKRLLDPVGGKKKSLFHTRIKWTLRFFLVLLSFGQLCFLRDKKLKQLFREFLKEEDGQKKNSIPNRRSETETSVLLLEFPCKVNQVLHSSVIGPRAYQVHFRSIIRKNTFLSELNFSELVADCIPSHL